MAAGKANIYDNIAITCWLGTTCKGFIKCCLVSLPGELCLLMSYVFIILHIILLKLCNFYQYYSQLLLHEVNLFIACM